MSTSSKSSVQRRSLTQTLEANRTFSHILPPEQSDYESDLSYYDDYTSGNDTEPLGYPGIDARSMRTSSTDEDRQNLTETLPEMEKPYWAFPTLPTITDKKNTDERIVGGDEAIPGEIPWQVQKNETWQNSSFAFHDLLFFRVHPGDPDVPLGGPADSRALLWRISAQRLVGHHCRPLPGE